MVDKLQVVNTARKVFIRYAADGISPNHTAKVAQVCIAMAMAFEVVGDEFLTSSLSCPNQLDLKFADGLTSPTDKQEMK